MFCPTAVDEFFVKKLSNLDLNFNKGGSGAGYQDRVSFEERVREAEDTKTRYPNKIPLVIEKHRSERSLPDIDKVWIGLCIMPGLIVTDCRSSGWSPTR